MTNILLTSIEPQLAQRLQQRAKENGRTIEAEIATILASVLTPERNEGTTAERNRTDLATAIRQRFGPLGGIDIPEMPREPIRAIELSSIDSHNQK